MHGIVIREFGPASVLRPGEFPDPPPRAGEGVRAFKEKRPPRWRGT